MQEKILILDFGSQYTQLIARRVRELNVYCEIYPFNHYPALDASVKGVILSGSPFSVRDEKAPQPDLSSIKGKLPLLGVCYGAQYLAHYFGGEVKASNKREYGRANLSFVDNSCPLFKNISQHSQVWMSHGDTIEVLPSHYTVVASTPDVENAAYRVGGEETFGILADLFCLIIIPETPPRSSATSHPPWTPGSFRGACSRWLLRSRGRSRSRRSRNSSIGRSGRNGQKGAGAQ